MWLLHQGYGHGCEWDQQLIAADGVIVGDQRNWLHWVWWGQIKMNVKIASNDEKRASGGEVFHKTSEIFDECWEDDVLESEDRDKSSFAVFFKNVNGGIGRTFYVEYFTCYDSDYTTSRLGRTVTHLMIQSITMSFYYCCVEWFLLVLSQVSERETMSALWS